MVRFTNVSNRFICPNGNVPLRVSPVTLGLSVVVKIISAVGSLAVAVTKTGTPLQVSLSSLSMVINELHAATPCHSNGVDSPQDKFVQHPVSPSAKENIVSRSLAIWHSASVSNSFTFKSKQTLTF